MSARAAQSDKLLLALDLGNTNLGCALFAGPSIVARATIPVAELADRADLWGGRFPEDLFSRVGASILSSVNPPAAALVVSSLQGKLGRAPLLLGSDLRVPVVARVESPAEVGMDRLLNVLAAYHRTHSASLVIDLGSALTIDVCSADGAYLGGIIAPGLDMSAAALHEHTALLPQVRVERPANVTGRNTVDCLRSGLFWGSIAMIEGLVTRLRIEHPDVAYVFATGGGAPVVSAACPVIDEVLPDLQFEGLRLVAESAGLRP